MLNNLDSTADTLMATSPLDGPAICGIKEGTRVSIGIIQILIPPCILWLKRCYFFLRTLGNDSCLPGDTTRAWFQGGLREDQGRLPLDGLRQNCGYLLRFLWFPVLSLCVVLRQDPDRPGVKLSKLQPCLLTKGLQTCNCTRVTSIT